MRQIQLLIILSVTMVSSREASAYLDPGSGSYMVQILIGLFLGGFFALKLYWRKLKGFIFKGKKGDETEK